MSTEKALQIETNPTGKHRCINCGQLKPADQLYQGGLDWACVNRDHCGPERDPIREDYKELTNSFARILFMTANPDLFASGQYESDKHDALMQEHFLGNARAYQLLRKLVADAMESKGAVAHRQLEITIKDRIWIHLADDLTWHYVVRDSVVITTQLYEEKRKHMAAGKRQDGRPSHLKSAKKAGVQRRPSKKPASANAGNLELPARVWTCGGTEGHIFDKPMNYATVEYAHLDPIRKALAACQEVGDGYYAGARVIIRNEDWEALVALIKGDANGK